MFISRRRRLQLQLLGALAVVGALVYYNESGAGVHDSAVASHSAAADDAGWSSVNAGAPPLAMAMRHCAYSSVPDRVFTKDIFAQAMADPAMSKMFQVGGCKGGAYGGGEVIGAFKAHGFASVSQHEAHRPPPPQPVRRRDGGFADPPPPDGTVMDDRCRALGRRLRTHETTTKGLREDYETTTKALRKAK